MCLIRKVSYLIFRDNHDGPGCIQSSNHDTNIGYIIYDQGLVRSIRDGRGLVLLICKYVLGQRCFIIVLSDAVIK